MFYFSCAALFEHFHGELAHLYPCKTRHVLTIQLNQMNIAADAKSIH